jgi:hypothetical protein
MKKGSSIVMQYDLNQLEVGRTFLPTFQLADMLAILFICMTFTSGLPLLTPIAFFGFFFYFRFDKYYIGKIYRKPSILDDRMIRVVISYLPYCVILRCIFAIWMFSSANILPANLPLHPFLFGLPNEEAQITGATSGLINVSIFNMSSYYTFLESLYLNYVSLLLPSFLHSPIRRILQMNTFPLFLLFFFIIIFWIFIRIWKLLPLQGVYDWYYRQLLLTKKKNTIFSNAKGKGHIHPFDLILTSQDPLRTEAAPLTGIYYQYLTKNKQQAENELNPKSCLIRYCCCCFYLFSLCGCCKKATTEEAASSSLANSLNDIDLDDDSDLDGELAVDLETGGISGKDDKGRIVDPNRVDTDERTWYKFCKLCFTGQFFKKPQKYLLPLIGIKKTTASMKRKNKIIKNYDQLDGWEITDMGFDFEVKVKVWSNTSKLKQDDKGMVSRMKGQHKKTYEVINDFRCNTYHLSSISSYALVFSHIFDSEIDIDGSLLTGSAAAANSGKQQLTARPGSPINKGVIMFENGKRKIYNLVDYYITNWKKENAHKIFDPQRIEEELVLFDEKQKQENENKKLRKQSKIVPFEGLDGDDSSKGDLSDYSIPTKRKTGLLKKSNSRVSFEDNSSNHDTAKSVDETDDEKKKEKKGEQDGKNSLTKKGSKKRTFVVDANEEEEDEEEDEDDEEEESDESDTEDSEDDDSDESSEEETSEESESSEDDEEDEEEDKKSPLPAISEVKSEED